MSVTVMLQSFFPKGTRKIRAYLSNEGDRLKDNYHFNNDTLFSFFFQMKEEEEDRERET